MPAAAGDPHAVSHARPAARVFVERSGSLALERAQQSLQAGRAVEAIGFLQQILDRPIDSFIATPDGAHGARDAAEGVLDRLPQPSRQLYEAMHTASAAAALREALESREPNLLSEVARRFPSTGPGFRAADRLAAVSFDRGDFRTAARLWNDLLSDPIHASRVNPALVAKALLALRRAGQDGRVSELAVRYAGMPLRVAGEPATIGSLLGGMPPSTSLPPTAGHAAGFAPGLTPPGYPPVWHHEPGESAAVLSELWAHTRRSAGRPAATPAAAVVSGQELVVREPSGVTSYALDSGRPLWHAPLHATAAESTTEARPDLHGLTRFDEAYAGNGVSGELTTDGDRVYVVDQSDVEQGVVRTASRSPVPVYERQPDTDQANRLLALPLGEGPSTREPVWVAGGTTESAAGDALAGHYFFGPPVVADGRLLALTERRQCLNLVALDPPTGDLRWQQPLGFVPRPVAADSLRAATACRPAVGDGIAVCATNAGFVVAVDYVTHRLLWAYEYAHAEVDPSGSADWPPDRSPYHGDPAVSSPVVIRGDQVVFLPHDSARVHCLDLKTGSLRWTAPREDGLYVACVTDDSLLVVGRSSCRGLSVVSGSPLWTTRLGAPSGTGVVTDSTYLLPLEDGLVVGVDLATGRRTGFDVPRGPVDFRPLEPESPESDSSRSWRPGNLFTDGRSLISVGASGVTRLETAAGLLSTLPPKTESLESARAQLAAGQLDEARPQLESILHSPKGEPQRSAARRLLRELHYLRLEWQPPDDFEEALAELDRLSTTPAERGRFLLQAADRHLHVDDADAARRRLLELADLDLTVPLPAPSDATHLVTAASWVPAVLRQLPSDVAVSDVSDAALADRPSAELRRQLLCEPDGPHAAPIRVELARRAIDDGEFHQAELLLLQAARDSNAADVAEQLARLRHRCGITDPQDHELADRTIDHVRVTGKLWSPADDGLRSAFGRSRRGFITRGQEPFRVVDRGDSRRARLAVLNLDHGICLGEVTLDARLRFPTLNRQPENGHFIPVATTDRVYGISLLETRSGTPVWQSDLPGDDGLLPQIGPYGPSFCTIQTRRALTVLAPATGGTLWRRTELPADHGLHGDHATGLFGDREALALLGADGVSYTVYRTRTGEELSRGRLPIDHRRQRRAYGRRLFYVETAENGSAARLWDSATNDYDLDVPFQGRLLQTSTRDNELVLLFADGRLMIVDPESTQVAVDVQLELDADRQPHTIQVFADSDRYYVSLYQADPDRFEGAQVTSYVYDTPLTVGHVQGRLLAIDRRTEKVLWSRPTEQRSILDPADHPLPFLVALARVSDRRFGNRKTLLVEAVDKQTGATIGRNDALMPDQLLQVRREPNTEMVELAGMTSTVVLDFRDRPCRSPIAHKSE